MLGMGNAGFRLKLIGYGTWEMVLLKMSDLPFIWILVHRPPDAPFLDPSFEFSTTSESVRAYYSNSLGSSWYARYVRFRESRDERKL